MSKKTRRRFSPEFKSGAVEMATRPGAMIAHAARDLEIGEGSLHEWIKQSRGVATRGLPVPPVKFRAIQMEKASFPISMMCSALGVSRSGFAAFDTRPVSAQTVTDAKLAVEVTEIFNQKRKRYGSPRIQIELESRGQRHSRKRIARVMRGGRITGYSRSGLTMNRCEKSRRSNVRT